MRFSKKLREKSKKEKNGWENRKKSEKTTAKRNCDRINKTFSGQNRKRLAKARQIG